MKLLKLALVAIALVWQVSAFGLASEKATKNSMKADLDIIKNTFEVYYAPKEWKKNQFGWDLSKEIKKAKEKIEKTEGINVKKFQHIVRDFFNSTKDYHVKVHFHSTESSTLPFSVKAVEGRYFISYVNYSILDQLVFPLFVGDELVLFNNRPIAEVIKELKESISLDSNSETDEEMTAFFLTHRSGKLGHIVPRGEVNLVIKSALTDDETKTIQLIWNYTPEKISNGFNEFSEKTENKQFDLLQSRLYDKLMVMPSYSILASLYHNSKEIKADNDDEEEEDNEEENFLGSKNSMLPSLGTVWWENSPTSSFQAYIFETENHKRVGFIRIPHYIGGGWNVDEFASIISFFEERTEALVIDQMNNPGGSLIYTYGLLSTLTDKPLLLPKERIMITQEEVIHALAVIEILELIKSNSDAQALLGSDIEGLPVTYQTIQRLLDYFKFTVSEWEAGRKFTDSCYLLGFNQILPHPTAQYTKPIVLLVNSLDFSCGDFFPAILQDNKRATLLGTRTAGAGGYVVGAQFPNIHGISQFSLTGSIAERLNSHPIENLGVTPDIECKFTINDILFDYEDFSNKINETLINLL